MSKATPENAVKHKIKQYLDSIGAFHMWPVPTGYGPKLVDCYGCLDGKFFAIEVKRPGILKPTPHQNFVLRRVGAAKGLAFTTDSVERVQKMIEDHILGAYKFRHGEDE